MHLLTDVSFQTKEYFIQTLISILTKPAKRLIFEQQFSQIEDKA